MIRAAAYALVVFTLAACGDNNGDAISSEAVYAGQCQSPRSGTDPFTGQPYGDVKGSLLDEQLWLRSWINDLYLWYREVPALDPHAFATAVDYFDKLKTSAVTASGNPKDRFHFVFDTAAWESLSGSGVEAGYGQTWALLSDMPPRRLVVAFTQAGTPAAAAGITRGAEVLTIDGVDVVAGSDVDTLNRGLSPMANESHTFVLRDQPGATPRSVTLVAQALELTPVRDVGVLPAPNDTVGYILFTDHIATAEKELFQAIAALRDAHITDLVLDLRYNGGGLLDIAAQLGYMIAGPTVTAGKTFEFETFNDKHPTIDPVTGDALTPSGFISQTEGFSLPSGTPLPYLGLPRVFVLTGIGTCSASEAVLNGLAGVGVEVIQIGTTTCGKPYGFYPQDNCGTTYFAIQFQGVNDKGFGDYADGFTPGGVLHGCTVADDFTHALGDPAEAQLAAALAYRTSPTCPLTRSDERDHSRAPAAASGMIVKPIWRENRILRR